MNARLFADTPIGTLSEELLLQILSYFRSEELCKLSPSSKDLSRLSDDNFLWRDLYTREFGLMLSDKNAKAQYIAAYLFRQAQQETRSDLAQIKYRQLQVFLKSHLQDAWAKYYLGEMHFHGTGTIINTRTGLQVLVESAELGDYRAMMALVRIVAKNSDNLVVNDALLSLVKTFIPNLTYAFNHGYPQAAWSLGYLYKLGVEGLTAEECKLEAQDFYEAALNSNMPEAVDELMELNTDKSPLAYLASLEKKHAKSPRVLAEIHYQSGLIHHDAGHYSETMKAFEAASKLHHHEATKELGMFSAQLASQAHVSLTTKSERLNKAAQQFRKGFEANHIACTQGFFDTQFKLCELNKTSVDPLLDQFKQSFRNHNPLAAILISSLQSDHEYERFIADDIEKVFWLQQAAQSGSRHALGMLQRLADEYESAYACCALGIIHTFGILYSDCIAPDENEGQKYLKCALALDSDAINDYLKIATQHDPASKEVKTLLEKACPSQQIVKGLLKS